MAKTKRQSRLKRKARIRRKVTGTAERPRLTVFRSARHISAQVIDDLSNKVMAVATTLGKAGQGEAAGKPKVEQAKAIGSTIAGLCKDRGVTHVVFDRNGFIYHGRVKALANAAREAGLKF